MISKVGSSPVDSSVGKQKIVIDFWNRNGNGRNKSESGWGAACQGKCEVEMKSQECSTSDTYTSEVNPCFVLVLNL